jgi:hypothetical protein
LGGARRRVFAAAEGSSAKLGGAALLRLPFFLLLSLLVALTEYDNKGATRRAYLAWF